MSKSDTGHNVRYIYASAIFAALGGLLFGYDTGVISGAILYIREDFQLTNVEVEMVVSAVLLGAVIGAFFAGKSADFFGRKLMILLASILFVLGALEMSWATGMYWLIFGRFVVGFAIGMASMTVPLYIAEIAPPKTRGACVSLNQLAVAIGIFVSYLVNFGFSGTGGWRWMLGLAAIPGVILFIAMLILPETPRWLLSRNRKEDAIKVLKRIHDPSVIDKQIQEIEDSLSIQEGGMKELLRPGVRKALWIGLGLAVFQQITGINTVLYYAPTILKMSLFHTDKAALIATMGGGAVFVIMTVVAVLIVDRIGRRRCLLIGVLVMSLALIILGIAIQQDMQPIWKAVLIVGSLFLYIGAFSISLGPIFWLIIAEIYPLKVRGIAMSVATMANWAANFLVALTFLSLASSMGLSETFWLYAAIGIVCYLFVYFYVPETKGETLEQIEKRWL